MAQAKNSTVDLKRRRAPVQARAKRTYEKILTTAAELVEELGIERVNTNLIAQRAGVNISAVYKYFPNKHAIIVELAERLNTLQTELALNYIGSIRKRTSWEKALTGAIDVMVEGTRNIPGVVALQSAMQANPDLKKEYRRSNEQVAEVLMSILEVSGVTLPPRRRQLVGVCLGEMVSAMLDLSVAAGRHFDRRVIDELKRMQIGYIRTYLSS